MEERLLVCGGSSGVHRCLTYQCVLEPCVDDCGRGEWSAEGLARSGRAASGGDRVVSVAGAGGQQRGWLAGLLAGTLRSDPSMCTARRSWGLDGCAGH